MVLFPAIDVRRGRCVRLDQSAADRDGPLETDPFRVAAELARSGAEWIHVVDLDAAFGEGSNRPLIAELARAVPIRVQTGGGLRTEADLEEVLDGPVERAVLGTAARESPEIVRWAVRRWGSDRIAVGIDARGRRVAASGAAEGATDLLDQARALVAQGVRTLIYTDLDRDGKLASPNLAIAAELAEATGAEVVISGGLVGHAELDVLSSAVRDRPGITGAIVARALYGDRLKLSGSARSATA